MPTKRLVTSYEQDLALFPDRWHLVGWAAFAILWTMWFATGDAFWLRIGAQSATAIVGAVGLMILTGFCGQVSLGHAAFLAIGAYTSAVFAERLELPFYSGLFVGGAAAALFGLLIGPFALRLRGLYLAIVTVGLVFVVDHFLLNWESVTHGASGMAVSAHWGFGQGTLRDPSYIGDWAFTFEHKLFAIFSIVALVATWCCKNIQRTDLGRAMVAVRDHDLAAAVLGVSPLRTKVVAFGLSSFFAGVAGAMFGYQQEYLTVAPPFDLTLSIRFIAMIVLGGIGTTFGAVAGAIFYTAVEPLAHEIGAVIPWVNQLSSGQQSTLLFSVLVCVVLLYEPLGLLGIWLRIKRYFITWPFRY